MSSILVTRPFSVTADTLIKCWNSKWFVCLMNFFKFMAAKKKLVEEVVESVEGNVIVHSNGVEVKRFTSITEAYTFASENGYSVEAR